jgi:WD40 repeat protein
MECRGCVFSPDGRYIYTIQSGKRGPSHIVKWLIKDDNYEKDATFKVTPEEVIAAGKVPLTKLRINSRGDVLATGGSDGLISVYNAVKCKKIRVFPNHDLPVTGMAFAPDFVAAGAKATDLLVSCSADNKLATVKLQKSSAVMVWALVLVLVLLALYLYIHVLTT